MVSQGQYSSTISTTSVTISFIQELYHILYVLHQLNCLTKFFHYIAFCAFVSTLLCICKYHMWEISFSICPFHSMWHLQSAQYLLVPSVLLQLTCSCSLLKLNNSRLCIFLYNHFLIHLSITEQMTIFHILAIIHG